MKELLFSIIVPIYNVEAYLKQCLDSILMQDLESYELLLIDDGSTDSSGLICDEYEKNNDKITVIHKKNGGLSDARNVGINKACGQYVWFIDSDDYLLEKAAFRVVSNIIKRKSPDVVLFSYKKYYENTGCYSANLYERVSGNDCVREWIKENVYKAIACNKVVRTALIKEHDMCFPTGRTGEDLVWCADLLVYAKRICFCKNALFAYRQHKGSITGNRDKQFRMCHIKNTLFLLNKAIDKYKINRNGTSDDNLIGHYLAYEFSWVLGEAYPYWKEYRIDIKKLKFLLNYDLSKKVSKVKITERFLGLYCTALMLYIFIKTKKRKAG